MTFDHLEAELKHEGDILISASLAKGSQSRPLWKKLEQLPPSEMIMWADRFDSLCAISCEWALAQALESSMGIEVSERAQFVRTLLGELNRLIWLTTYLSRVTGTLGQKTLTQQVLVLREHVFVMQEDLTGGRILPQAFALGGVRRDFAMGDVQKVRQFMGGWAKAWTQWTELISGDPVLEVRLRGLIKINPMLIEKLGWWGIVGRSTGVAYDSRKLRPHGAYPFLNFVSPSRTEGDALARFSLAIEEVNLTLELIDQVLKNIPAEGVKKAEAKDLTPGFFFGYAESAKGPVISVIEVAGGGSDKTFVASVKLFSTGQRVWPIVDHLFHDIRAEDFRIALASIGVDAEESEI